MPLISRAFIVASLALGVSVLAQPAPSSTAPAIRLVPATQPTDTPVLPTPGKPIGDWPRHGFVNPSTQPYSAYADREFDEAFFRDAEARINTHRRAPFRIKVLNPDGTPAAAAKVHVRMKRHAFLFGSALGDAMFLPNRTADQDRARFQSAFAAIFNGATLEGGLRWHHWEDPKRRPITLQIIEWLESHRIALRGHTLVYPGWQHLPDALRTLESDPDALRRTVADHVREQATALRGRVWAWDVLNEPHSHQHLQRVLGYETTADWFRIAREADPQARLVVNENNTVESGQKLDGFVKAIDILVNNNAPFDAIGLQGHFRASRFDPEKNPLPTPQLWWERLQRFAQYGKRLEITEFDIFNDTPDAPVQFTEADEARLMYEYLTLTFSHPQVDCFFLWGFWDGSHWMNNAPIYRRDWTLKPSGQVFFNLVYDRWWTDEMLTTDAEGDAVVSGFLGNYTVSTPGASVDMALDAKGATIVLRRQP